MKGLFGVKGLVLLALLFGYEATATAVPSSMECDGYQYSKDVHASIKDQPVLPRHNMFSFTREWTIFNDEMYFLVDPSEFRLQGATSSYVNMTGDRLLYFFTTNHEWRIGVSNLSLDPEKPFVDSAIYSKCGLKNLEE